MPKEIFIKRIVPIMRYVSPTSEYRTYSDAAATTPVAAFYAANQPYPLTVQGHYYYFRIEGRGFNKVDDSDLSKVAIRLVVPGGAVDFETVDIDKKNSRTIEVTAKLPDNQEAIDIELTGSSEFKATYSSGNSSEIEITVTADDNSETEGGLYP